MPPKARTQAGAPSPDGKFEFDDYALRVRLFKRHVLAQLPPAKRQAFLDKWPTFIDDADYITWDDARTTRAIGFYKEAVGTAVPDDVRPLMWSEVRAIRSVDGDEGSALAMQRRLQMDHGTAMTARVGLDQGPGTHWNDLNTQIYHDGRDVTTLPPEAVVFLEGHEIGHRVLYPGDHTRRAYAMVLMDMHGGAGRWKSGNPSINYPGKSVGNLFCNWLGDQIINYRFQYMGSQQEDFAKGMRWMLRHSAGMKEKTGSPWFFKMHFRLLWASSVMKMGYPDANAPGGWRRPPSDVGRIPEVLTIGGQDFPMVTFDDGPEWLWGGTRLPALWNAINRIEPAIVEDRMKDILELVEPFYFEPPIAEGKNKTPTNPDGVLCPSCKTADKMYRMSGTKVDPRDGKPKPMYGCNRCKVHEKPGLGGFYRYDKSTSEVRKVAEAR